MFGRHMIRYRDPGLTRDAGVGPGWFAVLTGLPDIELNVAGIHRPAGVAEAHILVDRIDRIDKPALIFVSHHTEPAIRTVLAERGFTPTVVAEPLMWRAGTAVLDAGSIFTVQRVADEAGLAGLVTVLEAAISMPADVTRRQFALERLTGDGSEGLGSWVAWDVAEPVSAVTLSWDADACAVWEMMTMPSHRRRGAGRTVLGAALAAVLRPSMAGTVLVSTPLGRQMYEAMGFAAIDESITWTRGASAADLARVGQTTAPNP